jgi:hypothetical protein
MLRNFKNLRGYKVIARDGAIGSVNDLYFDDERWAVRYFVVDTGNWLSGRRVLISPISVERSDWVEGELALSLTRAQVEGSPPIDTHKPVSRQYEAAYADAFGYPYYWMGPGLWGATPQPIVMRPGHGPAIQAHVQAERREAAQRGDEHLRSCSAVAGYHIHALDGQLGHVEDFLIDDLDWAIRYVVVDTSNWWVGKRILLPPGWVVDVNWSEQQVAVDVDRETVRTAPEFDALEHVNRQWEADYHAHYRRPGYWITPEEAERLKKAHRDPVRNDRSALT